MIDEAKIFNEGPLEPVVEIGIVRTMSDVLLGIGTPHEESTTASAKHHAHNDSHVSIDKSYNRVIQNTISHKVTAGIRQLDSAAYTLATLLLPYLDLTA
jgi:hypothetical protein